jgi:hypothetical protein
MAPAAAKAFVKTACGPLLEVLDDETVQIIHHSLTEFLLDRDRRTTFPVLEPVLIHRQLALICISTIQEQHDSGEHPLKPLPAMHSRRGLAMPPTTSRSAIRHF